MHCSRIRARTIWSWGIIRAVLMARCHRMKRMLHASRRRRTRVKELERLKTTPIHSRRKTKGSQRRRPQDESTVNRIRPIKVRHARSLVQNLSNTKAHCRHVPLPQEDACRAWGQLCWRQNANNREEDIMHMNSGTNKGHSRWSNKSEDLEFVDDITEEDAVHSGEEDVHGDFQ